MKIDKKLIKELVDHLSEFNLTELEYQEGQTKIKVSKATAYRTLDLLVKYDFCRKMVLDDGIARYENKLDSDHHDHMICIDTGKILEFYSPEIERIQDEIAEKEGYKIIKHVHQLFVKKINKT